MTINVRTRRYWLRAGGLGVAAAMLAATATSASAGQAAAARPRARAGASAARSVTRPAAALAAGVPKLTVQQMAGQRVIYSYPGLTPPASLLWLIRHGDVGGVIFFGQNIASEAQVAGVIRELDAANASTLNPARAYPLLLMTDQEGGEVRRLPGAPALSEKQIGESRYASEEATAAGKGAAANLRGVGMNVNLAPVLDVYRQAGDFDDQYGRSYSMNPQVVSYLGSDFIKAQQAGGVAATAKHFPGLGAAAADQDTDTGPVVLNLSAATIRGVDELPYKAAIADGVDLIMVSWAFYPALGGRPAGLSPAIVQGELRGRLGYKGVTITDALEAGGLRAYGSIGNRALLAAEAGMDLILCSGQDAAEGSEARDSLADGYKDGKLGAPSFDAALNRVLALRARLP